MTNVNRLIHCLLITMATLFLPVLAGEKQMIENEAGLIKHLKTIQEYAFPHLPGNNTKQEIQNPTLKDFIFYEFERYGNNITITLYFSNTVNKNYMEDSYDVTKDNGKDSVYSNEQIATCKNCINAMIDPNWLKPNRAVFSYRDITQGDRFKQVSFYNNEQLIYKNLHFQDHSLGFDFMNIRHVDSFFNKQYEPRTFIKDIKKVEFFNGWYTEKIGTYDNEGAFRLKTTWQHYAYCISKYSIMIGFVYWVLHKACSISI